VARGEGERTIVELLHALGPSKQQLMGIQGLAMRGPDGLVRTPPRPLIANLDELPFPHSSAPTALRDYDRYPTSAFAFVFATRGCPYGCAFCGSRQIWGRKVRYRSPGNVARELKALQDLGCTRIRFDDDTFGVSHHNMRGLCSHIRVACPGLQWVCEIPVPLANQTNIDLMKAAGCCQIKIGVESGNNQVLRQIGKNTTVEQSFAAAELIRRSGVEVMAFFMIGHTCDTEETIEDTMRAIRRIKADFIILSVFNPYPGTPAFDECMRLGLIGDDYDPARHNHQSAESCFTPHIKPERFRVLVQRCAAEVDGINRRRRLALHVRGYASAAAEEVRQRGVWSLASRASRLVGRYLGGGPKRASSGERR